MEKSNFLKNHKLISKFLPWFYNLITEDASEKKLAQMDAVCDTTYIFSDFDTFLEKIPIIS